MKTSHARQLIITSPIGRDSLHGTLHPPLGNGLEPRTNGGSGNRVGVLFLNSGFLPRSGSGDSAVQWADSVAQQGYPAFRIDLPGLGDSKGHLPLKFLDLVRLINAGYHSKWLRSTVRDLAERFFLAGVILVGPCAGATSAIYGASDSTYVKGIVLLDPYFHLPQDRSNIPGTPAFAALMNRIRDTSREAANRLRYEVQGRRLPKNTNFPLIRRWKRLASANLPILVFTADTTRPRPEEFDYVRYLETCSPRNGSLVVKRIEGTDHSFLRGPGKEAVRMYVGQWLDLNFPLMKATARADIEHEVVTQL